jgi:hypothetical protein
MVVHHYYLSLLLQTMMMHTVRHYPYRFRFVSFFVAGFSASVAYTLTEYAYNKTPPAATGPVKAPSLKSQSAVAQAVKPSPSKSTAAAAATTAAAGVGAADAAEDDLEEAHAALKVIALRCVSVLLVSRDKLCRRLAEMPTAMMNRPPTSWPHLTSMAMVGLATRLLAQV